MPDEYDGIAGVMRSKHSEHSECLKRMMASLGGQLTLGGMIRSERLKRSERRWAGTTKRGLERAASA